MVGVGTVECQACATRVAALAFCGSCGSRLAPAVDAPSGEQSRGAGEDPVEVLTLMLTDVEGSTRLWELYRREMSAALRRLDDIIVAVVAANGGTVVKTKGEGDSTFSVFNAAATALNAALELQLALHEEQWPPEVPLRVRVALHTGEVEPRDGDYYGRAVNRAARLRAAAHGGQTVLSEATSRAAVALPIGTHLRDVGRHRLKDLDRPEQVFQLCHPRLPAEFPPLRSLDGRRHNLPFQLTRFVGRDREVYELRDRLRRDRLVTLTGPGGSGKTRLSLEVAGGFLDDHPDGVWLVELAPLPVRSDVGAVAQQVAAALTVRHEPGRSVLDTLLDHLRPRRLLLVLDNCEHVAEAAGAFAHVVATTCPGVRLLASSRQPLGVSGEHVCPVLPLDLPALATSEPDALIAFPSVELFVDRAALADASFRLSFDNAAPVVEIVRRLDGIPLAIELAAAWVKTLSPAHISARLAQRFCMLSVGSASSLPHHRTLRALVDWSHDLLTDEERTVFRRCSVFRGRFSIEAAEDLCTGGGVEKNDVLAILRQLADKSLLTADPTGEGAVLGMLETVREYGTERLCEAGEHDGITVAFRGWYLGFCERVERELYGPEQGRWMERLESEHDNLRQALEDSVQAGELEAVQKMASALWRFWWIRGYLGEGRAWLERGLAHDRASVGVRARALHAAGALAWDQGDLAAARRFLAGGLALFSEQGNGVGAGFCLVRLGATLGLQGEFPKATALLEHALALGLEIGDHRVVANSLQQMGLLAMQRGDVGEARDLWRRSYDLFRQVGDTWGTFASLGDQGETAMLMGDHDSARRMLEKSLSMATEMRDMWRVARCLGTLGDLANRRGDVDVARRLQLQALRLRRDIGEKAGIAESIEALARAAVERGEAARAARLLGSADRLREAIGAPVLLCRAEEREVFVGRIRAALAPADFAAAWTEGRAMTVEKAVSFALEQDDEEMAWTAA